MRCLLLAACRLLSDVKYVFFHLRFYLCCVDVRLLAVACCSLFVACCVF